MNKITTEYQNYIFTQVNDRDRLLIQHDINKPHFLTVLQRVLDEFGLAEQLQIAKARREKIRILDFGCGEGMFLHDVAEVLEGRGLLEAAELNGIDNDQTAIATADDCSKLSRPPRPYLNFYMHDATRPLEECAALLKNGQAKFDFIFAILVIEHLPQARQHVEKMYNALNPGGILYLCDFVSQEGGEIGWVLPHPAMTEIGRILNTIWNSKNGGSIVALEQSKWLQEIVGAVVEMSAHETILGGDTKPGMDALRNFLMGVRNASTFLISRGIITQGQLDEMLTILYRELNRTSQGRTYHTDTLAHKPIVS